MNRASMVVVAIVLWCPLLVTPAQAEVCGITMNQERSALARIVPSTRERLEAHQAALPELSALPSEIQMALVRDRAPNWHLPGSFYGRTEQRPAMNAAADAARQFRDALMRMASASQIDEIMTARNAALAAIAANQNAFEGFMMSTSITSSARTEAGNLVRAHSERSARLSTLLGTYAEALTTVHDQKN